MGKGRKPDTLYSVWRNKDDELLILDGTMEQCCERLGISRWHFYKIVNSEKNTGFGHAYTVRKITKAKSKREENS